MEKDFFLRFAENAESVLGELTEGPSPVLDVISATKTGDSVLEDLPHDHRLGDGSEMPISESLKPKENDPGNQEIAKDAIRHVLSGDIME